MKIEVFQDEVNISPGSFSFYSDGKKHEFYFREIRKIKIFVLKSNSYIEISLKTSMDLYTETHVRIKEAEVDKPVTTSSSFKSLLDTASHLSEHSGKPLKFALLPPKFISICDFLVVLFALLISIFGMIGVGMFTVTKGGHLLFLIIGCIIFSYIKFFRNKYIGEFNEPYEIDNRILEPLSKSSFLHFATGGIFEDKPK